MTETVTAQSFAATAQRAKEKGNYKREVELLEQAIAVSMTPALARRYVSALYRAGEYRTAASLVGRLRRADLISEEFYERISEQLQKRGSFGVLSVWNQVSGMESAA